MTESRPIRLCIIEDHAIVRAGLKLLLAAEPDLQVVGEAVDRESALEIAKRECRTYSSWTSNSPLGRPWIFSRNC